MELRETPYHLLRCSGCHYTKLSHAGKLLIGYSTHQFKLLVVSAMKSVTVQLEGRKEGICMMHMPNENFYGIISKNNDEASSKQTNEFFWIFHCEHINLQQSHQWCHSKSPSDRCYSYERGKRFSWNFSCPDTYICTIYNRLSVLNPPSQIHKDFKKFQKNGPELEEKNQKSLQLPPLIPLDQ